MWFEKLTGFREKNPEQVRSNLQLDGTTITSLVNGKSMVCGTLETPSLENLRTRVREGTSIGTSIHSPTRLSEIIGDVRQLHQFDGNANSTFQVASQFNLLEMVSPFVTPEDGVALYENDWTQGPACAIAAGAGTIYRNYYAHVNGQTGQTEDHQIDCLAEMGTAFGNSDEKLWAMKNGYALASQDGLGQISIRLSEASAPERESLRGLLRIGIQSDTQVTIGETDQRVNQIYCSALPVAYSDHPEELWSAFARLVLEAAYEATFWAALESKQLTGNNKLFLTMLGGGAFGNRPEWIISAIERAVSIHSDSGLDVAIVSFRNSCPHVSDLVRRWNRSRP